MYYYYPTAHQYLYDPRNYQIYNTESDQDKNYNNNLTGFYPPLTQEPGRIDSYEIENNNLKDKPTIKINAMKHEVQGNVELDNTKLQPQEQSTEVNLPDEEREHDLRNNNYSELIYRELQAIKSLLEKNRINF